MESKINENFDATPILATLFEIQSYLMSQHRLKAKEISISHNRLFDEVYKELEDSRHYAHKEAISTFLKTFSGSVSNLDVLKQLLDNK